jgi:hypothetical protein
VTAAAAGFDCKGCFRREQLAVRSGGGMRSRFARFSRCGGSFSIPNWNTTDWRRSFGLAFNFAFRDQKNLPMRADDRETITNWTCDLGSARSLPAEWAECEKQAGGAGIGYNPAH